MESRLFFCAPFLAYLAAEDFLCRKVPDRAVMAGAAAAFFWHPVFGRSEELPLRLLGALGLGLLLAAVRAGAGLGGGDVKAAAMLALWFPPGMLLKGLWWGTAAGLLWGLLFPAEGEKRGFRLRARLKKELPLLPFWAAGLAGEVLLSGGQ